MAAVKRDAVLGLMGRGYPGELILAWADNLNTRWLGRALHAKGSTGFLLEDNTRALGSAFFQGGRVKSLYVRPQCWRRGAGRILLEACEAAAREKGAERIALFAALDSRAFYRSLGYREIKRGGQNLPGGQVLTGWEMEKPLAWRGY